MPGIQNSTPSQGGSATQSPGSNPTDLTQGQPDPKQSDQGLSGSKKSGERQFANSPPIGDSSSNQLDKKQNIPQQPPQKKQKTISGTLLPQSGHGAGPSSAPDGSGTGTPPILTSPVSSSSK